MSATNKPDSHRRTIEPHDCTLREEFERWQHDVNRRLDDGSDEMGALAASISELSGDIRDMRRSQSGSSEVILREISNLNQRTATMLEVAAADRNKRDIQSKTPGRPELKLPGGTSLKAGPLTIVAVVLIISSIAIPAVAWTYVAVRGMVARIEAAKP
jgi:hypothetical protein